MVDVRLMQGDCLEVMSAIETGSVDCIISDLPYGTTKLPWDSVIPLEPLWKQYKRVIKKGGAIVLFGSQPFTSALVMSNPAWFRYEWIWEKSTGVGFLDANRRPLKCHENIIVFCETRAPYAPQMTPVKQRVLKKYAQAKQYGSSVPRPTDNKGAAYPRSVLYHQKELDTLHPTQKPVKLLEFLILTYTQAGETVLDSCMGSGSTGAACLNTGRNFIGIEKDEHYFSVAKRRLEQPYTLPMIT